MAASSIRSLGRSLTLLALTLTSCVPFSKDAIKVTPQLDTTIGVRRGDSSLEVGTIGGGSDSIALWLAIGGLAITPILGGLFYQHGLRPRRLRRLSRQVEEIFRKDSTNA